MKYRFDEIAINSTEKKKPVEEDKNYYLGLEHLDPKQLKVTRYGSEVAPIGEKLIMKKGDVLFGKRRAYQKKVAIAPFDGIFSAHGMVLRPNEEVISKELFPFFISSDYFLDNAIRISVGSLSPTINWGDLRKLEFSLPDKNEQDKIAEVLWAIEENIESYKKLLLATEELIKAQFSSEFGENMIKKNKWDTVPITEIIQPLFSGEWGKEDNDNTGVPIIRTTNFTDIGRVDLSEVVTRKVAEDKVENKKLQVGDIIIEKSGGSGLKPVGRVILWDKDILALTNNFTAIIRVKNNKKVNPVYLFRFLFDRYWMDETRRYENKTTGIHNLRLEEYLENTKIPIVPLILQTRFVEFVNMAEKSKDELSETITTLQSTKNAIIKKYFG